MKKPPHHAEHRKIRKHFLAVDPIMAKVIEAVGPAKLEPQRDRFAVLVRSIISQQISTAAARSIRARLEERLAPERIRPETIARLSIDELRSIGLSRPKAGYLHDLAEKCADGTVRLSRLGRMSDEAVIEELIQIKGIGRWSAQMFLIFSLGRPDVFPLDDLGVRSAMASLYRFDQSHGKQHYLAIGESWKPYATIGSWYCWRYLDISRQEKKANAKTITKPVKKARR
jgi:DNA-3-methyladenine glycosylase II